MSVGPRDKRRPWASQRDEYARLQDSFSKNQGATRLLSTVVSSCFWQIPVAKKKMEVAENGDIMRKSHILLIFVSLTACSSEQGKQVTSSALMGSALGIPGGPIGIAVGGAVGAAVGAALPQGAFDTSKNETANRIDQ